MSHIETDRGNDARSRNTRLAAIRSFRSASSAYGAADVRPAGIFGGFEAHFTDGHASGVYATRKP